MKANDYQVDGNHYSNEGCAVQHWDVVDMMNMDYFTGCATKYLARHRKKGQEVSLQKALHFCSKAFEVSHPFSDRSEVGVMSFLENSGMTLMEKAAFVLIAANNPVSLQIAKELLNKISEDTYDKPLQTA